MRKLVVGLCTFVVVPMLLVVAACGGSSAGKTPVTPPCDQTCQDQIGVTGMRELLKLVYNEGLYGQPVGPQDASAPCPLGGSAHVSGTASSNAVQGSTMVQLTYVLDQCVYVNVDPTTPTQNYSLTVTGTFTEDGTIAVQPSSTTALGIDGTGVTITGTVDNPPLMYDANGDGGDGGDAGGCVLQLQQDGNDVSGTICGRPVGVSL
jgi:hypothetical protein